MTWRLGRVVKKTASPTSGEVERKLKSTAIIFGNKDRDIADALRREEVVVLAWLHELLTIADEVDPEASDLDQQRFHLYSYWRGYQYFVNERLERLRQLKLTGQGLARILMASQTWPHNESSTRSTADKIDVKAVRNSRANLCLLCPFVPFAPVPALNTTSLVRIQVLTIFFASHTAPRIRQT